MGKDIRVEGYEPYAPVDPDSVMVDGRLREWHEFLWKPTLGTHPVLYFADHIRRVAVLRLQARGEVLEGDAVLTEMVRVCPPNLNVALGGLPSPVTQKR